METKEDDVAVIYVCDSCGCVGLRSGFKDVEDIRQRFEPGDTYTDAECPHCAALAFPKEVPVLKHQHKWSGWPGAVCMKCGAPHLLEQALADDVYDPIEDTWTDTEYRDMVADFDGLCPISDSKHQYDRMKDDLNKQIELLKDKGISPDVISKLRSRFETAFDEKEDTIDADVVWTKVVIDLDSEDLLTLDIIKLTL